MASGSTGALMRGQSSWASWRSSPPSSTLASCRHMTRWAADVTAKTVRMQPRYPETSSKNPFTSPVAARALLKSRFREDSLLTYCRL